VTTVGESDGAVVVGKLEGVEDGDSEVGKLVGSASGKSVTGFKVSGESVTGVNAGEEEPLLLGASVLGDKMELGARLGHTVDRVAGRNVVDSVGCIGMAVGANVVGAEEVVGFDDGEEEGR
jgi:hypothetical protein